MANELPKIVEDLDSLDNELSTLRDDMRETAEELAEHHKDLAHSLAECDGPLKSADAILSEVSKAVESRECGTGKE